MWVYRVGAEQAKRMLLTGDLISGVEAKRIGLVLDAVKGECGYCYLCVRGSCHGSSG